jgi:hypothetical protein
LVDPFHSNHKSVATWIPMHDYAMLQHLAFINNCTVATYIRGIITDAVQDEKYRMKNKKTIRPAVSAS